MNILITGAFGFVGTNLSRYIRQSTKHRLIALDISVHEFHKYHKFYNWNHIEKIDWKKIDIIIHLAGIAHDIKNTKNENKYFEVNVDLTKLIYEHFLHSSAFKFIFFSSVKAIADSVGNNTLFEDRIPNPRTPYGKSKLEAEKYLLNQDNSNNRNIYILRPCMIHGAGNKGNLNLLYNLVSKGIPWPLGAYENERSFTSIDNLTFIIQQIIEKDINPGIYNVADDEPISTNRIIELIAQSKGKKAKILKISPSFIETISKIGDKIPFPLNSERLRKLTESYVVSNKKLKKALGIDRMPVSAEGGMKKTLSTF